jgi:C_GCAxxG_C_C family probable redox protein
MNHGDKALALFTQGYNCAQATFLAFSDLTGLDEKDAARLASSFGGGIGRMREVCGAVSGIAMAAGWLYGYEVPGDDEEKKQHYARIQALAEQFRAEFGTILCRELLDNPPSTPDPTKRTPAFYHSRPCGEFVRRAAQLLDRYIAAHPIP